MTKRLTFDVKLNKITEKLVCLSQLIEEQIQSGIQLLYQFEELNQQNILSQEEKINHLEKEIEQECTYIIAQEQPVASDLRHIISIIHIVNNLERIGDYIVNISNRFEKLFRKKRPHTHSEYLITMLKQGSTMLSTSLKAYFEHDLYLSASVIKQDISMDKAYKKTKRALIEAVQKNNADIKTIFYILELSRDLERLGDHVVHVSERVIYQLTGQFDMHRSYKI